MGYTITQIAAICMIAAGLAGLSHGNFVGAGLAIFGGLILYPSWLRIALSLETLTVGTTRSDAAAWAVAALALAAATFLG